METIDTLPALKEGVLRRKRIKMKWNETRTLPQSRGMYGITNNKENALDFHLGYFNGEYWVTCNQSDVEMAPAREPLFWCILEIGRG